MPILRLDKISFSWEDLVDRRKSEKNPQKKISPETLESAKAAFERGEKLLDLVVSYEIYKMENIDTEKNILTIASPESGEKEDLYIGPRIGLLLPARDIAISVCTAGKAIAEAIAKSSNDADYLMMYYLDAFGVRALGELSNHYRSQIETFAKERGYGVGPSMQPGSVQGWEVSGQRDLHRLAGGEKIGLSVNEACFLVPHISNSALIGIGPDYSSTKIGSMCHECPRREQCLWRRENEDA